MLPRARRLDRASIAALHKESRTYRDAHFTLRGARLHTHAGKSQQSRFAVVVSKKVARFAVERHRVKRRTRAALAALLDEITENYHGIVFVHAPITTLSTNEIRVKLRKLLERATAIPAR